MSQDMQGILAIEWAWKNSCVSEYLIRSGSGVLYDNRRFTNDECNDI